LLYWLLDWPMAFPLLLVLLRDLSQAMGPDDTKCRHKKG